MDEEEKQELTANRRARLEAAITPQGSGGYGRQREVYRKPITSPEWIYWPAERIERWTIAGQTKKEYIVPFRL